MARRIAKPGERALRARYGDRLEAIRRRYEKQAGEFEKQARRADTDYKLMVREYRHEIAKLKRAGIIPSTVDVRRVKPTSSFSRVLNDFYEVVTGHAKTQKVSKRTARQLREEGFQVRNERVILEPSLKVRESKRKPGWKRRFETAEVQEPGVRRTRVYSIDPGEDNDDKLAEIFRKMHEDDRLRVVLEGRFTRLFAPWEFDEFLAYLEGGGSFANPHSYKRINIVVMTPDTQLPYFEEKERMRRHLETRRAEGLQRGRERAAATLLRSRTQRSEGERMQRLAEQSRELLAARTQRTRERKFRASQRKRKG